jgi:hypothetical protein
LTLAIDWKEIDWGGETKEAPKVQLPLGMLGNNMMLAMALKEQIMVFRLSSE